MRAGVNITNQTSTRLAQNTVRRESSGWVVVPHENLRLLKCGGPSLAEELSFPEPSQAKLGVEPKMVIRGNALDQTTVCRFD